MIQCEVVLDLQTVILLMQQQSVKKGQERRISKAYSEYPSKQIIPDQQHFHPKTLQSSNSHYTSLLRQCHQQQKTPSNKKSFLPFSNPQKQYRTNLTYLTYPSPQQQQFIVYCIVNKISQSGIMSHQRLLVVDSKKKEVKYYSKIPEKLPFGNVGEVEEEGEAKENVRVREVRGFKVGISRTGIGQLNMEWVEQGQQKRWCIKTASTAMCRQLVTVINSIKTGNYLKQPIQSRQPISSLRTSSISPQSKYIKSISTNVKKSGISTIKNNSQLANLLLKSLQVQHSQALPVYSTKNENKRVEEDVPVYRMRKEQQRMVQGQPREQKDKKEVSVYKGDVEGQLKHSDSSNEQEVVPLHVQRTGQSLRGSIKLDKILKDASIQHLQAIQAVSAPPTEGKRSQQQLSKLQKLIYDKKQQTKQPVSRPRTITKQEMGLSKVLVHRVSSKDSSRGSISRGNTGRSNAVPRGSVGEVKADGGLVLRQGLLRERKVGLTLTSPRGKQPLLLNPHSHPRRQSPRAIPPSFKLQSYIQQWRESRHLSQFTNWLLGHNRQQTYLSWLDNCIQHVKQLTNTFDSWHLFYRVGETYCVNEDNITMLFKMGEEGVRGRMEEVEVRRVMRCMDYLYDVVGSVDSDGGDKVKIAMPMYCLVISNGLQILCKSTIPSSIVYTTTTPTQHLSLLTTLTNATKLPLINPKLLTFTHLHQQWLYIDHAQLQLSLMMEGSNMVNIGRQYIGRYVGGVIREDRHRMAIGEHIRKDVLSQLVQQLQKQQPATCLQLEHILTSYGLDSTIIPLLLHPTYTTPSSHLHKLLLSHLLSLQLTTNLQYHIHRLLLSRQSSKDLSTQIYLIMGKVMRLDGEEICWQMWAQYGVEIILKDIQRLGVEEYIVGSVMYYMGIQCEVKEFREKVPEQVWNVMEFSTDHLNLQLQHRIVHYKYRNTGKQAISQGDRLWWFSPMYRLLPPVQKQQLAAQLCSQPPIPPNIPTQHPLSPIYSHSLSPFRTKYALIMIKTVITWLLNQQRYEQALKMAKTQRQRVGIWGGSSFRMRVEMEWLFAWVCQCVGRREECLQSGLLAIKRAILGYQQGAGTADTVVKSCYKSAQHHISYSYFLQSIQLLQTSQSLLPQCRQIPLYLSIYVIKSKLLLTTSSLSTQQYILVTLDKILQYKQNVQGGRQGQIYGRIEEVEFQMYMVLLREQESNKKYNAMMRTVQLMIDKYVINCSHRNRENKDGRVRQRQVRQARQVMRYWWVAVVRCIQHQHLKTYLDPMALIPLLLQLSYSPSSSPHLTLTQRLSQHQNPSQIMLSILSNLTQNRSEDKDELQFIAALVTVIGVQYAIYIIEDRSVEQ